MTKETLSDKIESIRYRINEYAVSQEAREHEKKVINEVEKDVREFIKKLKRKAKKGWEGYIDLIHIDDVFELAGEELTK